MKKHYELDQQQPIRRFPRQRTDDGKKNRHKYPSALTKEEIRHIWKGIPRLDLSKIKDSRFLIPLFLVEANIQLIFGTFGTRKTTVLLLAAWAVARGADFFGKKTRQRWVLYLDYENPSGVLKSYCKDLGIDPSDPAFTIWDRSEGPAPLPGDPALPEFIRRCKKVTGRYPWIIFDSWTSLLKSGESGDRIGEAAPIFQAIRAYRDLGATCTIIDHTGKDKRMREPIGTSAKMTQMDTSHFFTVQEEETSLDLDSSRTVIRIESFLKRHAPKDIGTFSLEIRAAVDKKGKWHTTSVEPTKDKLVLKLEHQIELLKRLIRNNPRAGQNELAELAAKEKIMGRDPARKLLHEGMGRYWEAIRGKARREQFFRVLESVKVPRENPKG
jgi:AAA domain